MVKKPAAAPHIAAIRGSVPVPRKSSVSNTATRKPAANPRRILLYCLTADRKAIWSQSTSILQNCSKAAARKRKETGRVSR